MALWHTLTEKVLPTLIRLWKEVIEPLIPVIGTTLVFAFRFAIDALNLFLAAIIPVINFMLNHKVDVLGLAAAFVILAVSMNFSAIAGAFNGAINSTIISINILRFVTIT